MYSYASRIEPQDRWAIVAYIRVLQESQYASVNDLSAEEKAKLDEKIEPKKEGAEGEHH
jgi:hypothetical protein